MLLREHRPVEALVQQAELTAAADLTRFDLIVVCP